MAQRTNKNWHYYQREIDKLQAQLDALKGRRGLVTAIRRFMINDQIECCRFMQRYICGQI